MPYQVVYTKTNKYAPKVSREDALAFAKDVFEPLEIEMATLQIEGKVQTKYGVLEIKEVD